MSAPSVPGGLRLTRKLHLTVVLPLVLVSLAVAGLTERGLETNAQHLAEALKVEAKANEVFSLLLIQEDTSKAILIDPDRIGDYSEAKLAAYDKHKALLAQLQEEIEDPQVQAKLREVQAIDAEKLRPVDTRILEQLFVDPAAARQLYFAEYEPSRKEYEARIHDLTVYASSQAAAAALEMQAKNRASLAQTAGVLLLGIAVIAGTIQVLGRRVETSQAHLSQLLRGMASLLRGMEEGLFYFDRTGAIASERSQALAELLPGSEACADLASFFEHYCTIDPDNVAVCLGLLWPSEEDFYSPFEATISFLPSFLEIFGPGGEKRTVHLRYKPHHDEAGQLDRVYVSVQDVTARLRSEEEARVQQERVDRIARVATNLDGFQCFVEEIDGLMHSVEDEVRHLDAGGTDRSDLQRYLHTIKGSVSICQFQALARHIHHLEDVLLGAPGAIPESFRQGWQAARAQWNAEVQDIREVLGLQESPDSLRVSLQKIADLLLYSRHQGDTLIQRKIEDLGRYPVHQLLGRHVDYMRALCQRRHNLEINVQFAPDSCEISQEEGQRIDRVLGHLLRNSADHGIESPGEREAVGKPRAGTIQIGCYRGADGALRWEITDDGRGIDGEKLAWKMVGMGLWSEEKRKEASAEEKLALIYVPSLSCRDQASDTSGRGVGMYAVRRDVEMMGGQISVTSRPGTGTRFLLHLPGADILRQSAAA